MRSYDYDPYVLNDSIDFNYDYYEQINEGIPLSCYCLHFRMGSTALW